MGKRTRPLVKLVIEKGSRLIDGRLPLARSERANGMEVVVDPVSFAALLASVGRLFTVDQVAGEMATMEEGREDAEKTSSAAPGEAEA